MGKKETLATSVRPSVCLRAREGWMDGWMRPRVTTTVLTDFTRDEGRESATGGDEETRRRGGVKTRRALSSSSYFSEFRAVKSRNVERLETDDDADVCRESRGRRFLFCEEMATDGGTGNGD